MSPVLLTELHRHLDVSLRSSTLLKLAQERGLEAQSTSIEAFEQKHWIQQPLQNLSSVLSKFTLYQQVLDRPDVLEQVAFEAAEDCVREGIQQVEFRFSPSFVCEFNHLPWLDALEGFDAGLKQASIKFPFLKTGLICIASRDAGIDSVAATVEFFLRYQERFIGLDLAGPEADYPCRLYEKIFRKALDRGAQVTIHAGEGAGPENIWEAIDLLGAQRIGHGVRCIQDPHLVKTLAKRQICLEICPTSNWITQAVSSLETHPLQQLLRAGIPISINTDDPGIFGITLAHEFEVCRKVLKMTEEDLDQCRQHAWAASFIGRK